MLKLLAFGGRVAFAIVAGLVYGLGYMLGAVRTASSKPDTKATTEPTKAVEHQATQVEVLSSPEVATAEDEAKAKSAKAAAARLNRVPSEAKSMQSENFRIAERVQTAELYGRGGIQLGVMWLYLYPEHSIAKRVFKVTHRPLAFALKWDRRYMPDVPFDPVVGHQGIMDAMYKECSTLLNRTERPAREKAVQKPVVKAKQVPQSKPKVTPEVKSVETEKPQQAQQAPAAQTVKPDVQMVVPSSHRAVKGETFEGRVSALGMTTKGTGEKAYQTFCLTIHDGDKETPLSGTELERQCRDLGVRPGDRIKVVYMGSMPVNIPGKKGSFKNLYQVTRADRT